MSICFKRALFMVIVLFKRWNGTMFLHIATLHLLILSLLADIPPCDIDWGQWGACSVTCGRGVRQRRRQCRSGDPLPIELQETEEDNCTAGNICPEDELGHSLLVQGHADFTLRNHVTKTRTVQSGAECGLLCSRDLSCRSFNLCGDMTKFLCELNNATHEDFKHDFYWTFTCSYYNTITRTAY